MWTPSTGVGMRTVVPSPDMRFSRTTLPPTDGDGGDVAQPCCWGGYDWNFGNYRTNMEHGPNLTTTTLPCCDISGDSSSLDRQSTLLYWDRPYLPRRAQWGTYIHTYILQSINA